MFDFDAGKLLIIGIVALIFIPSKDLPRVLRQLGQFVSKMRRMAGEFQSQFMDAMREADMSELRREAEKLSKSAQVDLGFHPVRDLETHLTGLIEGKPLLDAGEAEALGMASEAHTIAPPSLAAHGAADATFVDTASPTSVTVDPAHGIDLPASTIPKHGPEPEPVLRPAHGGA